MAAARVAIVTGAASKGIGRGIAMRLASDGLNVVVNDIRQKKDQLEETAEIIRSTTGRKSLAICGDVSEEKDVKGMVDQVASELGGLDVMVANAGVDSFVSLRDMTVGEWDRIMNINARGVMLSYKYAAEQMIKQGRGGRIIGASSIAGKKGLAYQTHYSASKFAVRGLTQSAALELAEHKITVNAYAPGAISSEIANGIDPKVMADMQMKSSLGNMKLGQPEDIAEFVSYLARPEAHFVTGQTVNVDGGLVFD